MDLRDNPLSPEEVAALRQALPGCQIRWDIPIGDQRFDSQAQEIAVHNFSMEEVQLFSFFDRLKTVDAREVSHYPSLVALYQALPDCQVLWTVELDGRQVSSQARTVTVSNRVTPEELAQALEWLPALENVSVTRCAYTPDQQEQLMAQFPSVRFCWNVTLCGETFSSLATQISFAGREDLTQEQLEEIRDNAFRFYVLQEIDLTDCGFDSVQLAALQEALDGPAVAWEFNLYGVDIRSTQEEVDLSFYRVRDGAAALEEAIPWMKNLTQVVMCQCGLSSKEMDALNQKYLPQGIRFVWMARVKSNGIRTDATWYIPYNSPWFFSSNAGTQDLQYCTDLIALDLGHTHIKDMSFLLAMPQLKYLILGDRCVTELTYVDTLKDLVWLELFQTSITDLTPLLGCTSLSSLNLCYIPADGDHAYEVLSQMTWLKRLWYCGTRMTDEQVESLRQLLPDCEIYTQMGAESTGFTWRFHPDYYEMRDAFHMYYMDDEGNTIHRRLTPEEVQERFFG